METVRDNLIFANPSLALTRTLCTAPPDCFRLLSQTPLRNVDVVLSLPSNELFLCDPGRRRGGYAVDAARLSVLSVLCMCRRSL